MHCLSNCVIDWRTPADHSLENNLLLNWVVSMLSICQTLKLKFFLYQAIMVKVRYENVCHTC